MSSALDDILARVQSMPSEDRAALEKLATDATAGMKWLPNPGPQTEAYFSPADVLLYGGQGGGGKTDLGLGLALTAHKRSLILRRKYANLSGLTERALEINGTRDGFNGSPPPLLRTSDSRYVQFAGNQHLGDEQDWQGQPFDLKVFDEATQFLELQIRFHIGWLRSTDEGQRVRAVLATNPPIDANGDFIIGMFRPWLDLTHHKPAKTGELRWYVTAPDGSDLEVSEDDLGTNELGRKVVRIGDKDLEAMSRTFIPAALKDNPYLINTGYQAKLDGLPEPIRSAVRDGNFMAARDDADNQVIPTAWIIAAQDRWTPRPPEGVAMTAMAIDPAGGGGDAEEVAHRYGGWYGPLASRKGAETKDGAAAAGVVFKHRKDSCPVIVDVGGGYGGAVILRLKDNSVEAVQFNGAAGSTGRATDGSGRVFANKRAEAWWRFREALDPDQEGGSVVALPPDPELRSDLAAPTFKPDILKIQIEAKEDIRKRIGRSPGKGDAVVMALSEGTKANKRLSSSLNGRTPKVVLGHANAKRRR
tara:strand:- start:22714 stop:24309 length:1596 start_codon:yes stop_codon:yes gene_type:complete